MKVIVVGLGVQGKKRKLFAGADFVASVDPVNSDAEFQCVEEVPLASFDAALVCLPDAPKFAVLRYLLLNGKHVLVEKPLWTERDHELLELEHLAKQKQLVCYTAYNHRFEPHFVRMKELLSTGELGRIYSCRLFYGNGTARLVRDSVWRDQGTGVLADLGSHLLDTLHFWFTKEMVNFDVVMMNAFENQAPDHVIILNQQTSIKIVCEMSLLSWRNHFVCDIVGERGSAHIESLCKWGPSTFTYRQRMLPSGRPPEEAVTLVQDDPTWSLEYAHFKRLVALKSETSLARDLSIQQELNRLAKGYSTSKEMMS
jgi:scyllo-inositol 2-dehydrogenase (NADP+)